MSLRLYRTFLTLILVTVFAAGAAAQTSGSPAQPAPTAPDPMAADPEAFNVTVFLGPSFGGDLDNTPAAFGVAAGYGLTQRLAVEADLSFAPAAEQELIAEFDNSVWSFSGNVLYHFVGGAMENFTPYVAAGIGLLSGNADAEDITPIIQDDTSTVFAWNFGAGLKTAMNANWGLRGDLRFFNGDDFAPDHWRLYGGVVIRRIGP